MIQRIPQFTKNLPLRPTPPLVRKSPLTPPVTPELFPSPVNIHTPMGLFSATGHGGESKYGRHHDADQRRQFPFDPNCIALSDTIVIPYDESTHILFHYGSDSPLRLNGYESGNVPCGTMVPAETVFSVGNQTCYGYNHIYQGLPYRPTEIGIEPYAEFTLTNTDCMSEKSQPLLVFMVMSALMCDSFSADDPTFFIIGKDAPHRLFGTVNSADGYFYMNGRIDQKYFVGMDLISGAPIDQNPDDAPFLHLRDIYNRVMNDTHSIIRLERYDAEKICPTPAPTTEALDQTVAPQTTVRPQTIPDAKTSSSIGTPAPDMQPMSDSEARLWIILFSVVSSLFVLLLGYTIFIKINDCLSRRDTDGAPALDNSDAIETTSETELPESLEQPVAPVAPAATEAPLEPEPTIWPEAAATVPPTNRPSTEVPVSLNNQTYQSNPSSSLADALHTSSETSVNDDPLAIEHHSPSSDADRLPNQPADASLYGTQWGTPPGSPPNRPLAPATYRLDRPGFISPSASFEDPLPTSLHNTQLGTPPGSPDCREPAARSTLLQNSPPASGDRSLNALLYGTRLQPPTASFDDHSPDVGASPLYCTQLMAPINRRSPRLQLSPINSPTEPALPLLSSDSGSRSAPLRSSGGSSAMVVASRDTSSHDALHESPSADSPPSPIPSDTPSSILRTSARSERSPLSVQFAPYPLPSPRAIEPNGASALQSLVNTRKDALMRASAAQK
jgi:hypothetical protein